jgi:steroid delta-isomerase-like uncharacterized protein
MNAGEMRRLFEVHRDAEKRRDFDAILETFTDDCYLETVPLGLHSHGKAATRASYEAFFTAFPDLEPEDVGAAIGEDVLVVWGFLHGSSGGEWLGVPPSGKPFKVPFTNVTIFEDGRMAGESIYFDAATLCEQAGLPLEQIRAAAKARASSS